MSILVIGVNHRTSPLALLERVAVAPDHLPKAIADLVSRVDVREAVVLSTCNRTEVYAVAERFHGAYSDIRDFFCELGGILPEDLHPHLYSQHDEAAISHLFEVASGLESAVLGETEILGQVRSAYESAKEVGSTGRVTNVLFQRALCAGKLVRNRTAIACGQTSAASVAVELARRVFGRLDSCRAMVLGAGEMAEKTARHLVGARVEKLFIANRTLERAERLAEGLGASALPWEEFPAMLVRADIVLCSADAPEPIVTRRQVEAAAALRNGRPLFFIDIGMPRNVAPGADEVPGIHSYALEDLRAIVEENSSRRAEEIEAARCIASSEADAFSVWLDALERGEAVSIRRRSAPEPVAS